MMMILKKIRDIKDKISTIIDSNIVKINEFVDYICSNYSIVEKGDWTNKTNQITNGFFEGSPLEKYKVPYIDNLGFWFRPESVIEIQIIKQIIDEYKDSQIEPILYCTLSETIRVVSNTRNGEFKLYRKKPEKILEKKHNPKKTFIDNLEKNIRKELSYIPFANTNSNVQIICENCQYIPEIKDGTIDVVITSPPYGDSHTTVAYGQFSRLSNIWLGLTEEKNLDSKLLGGTKIKNKDISELGSPTLEKIINQIESVDEKRAREALDFYFELDAAIGETTRKVSVNGYEFWVVGNRTVKLVNIPTDIILEELGKKYHLIA